MLQVAVCAIAKFENNYIREGVEHYLSFGFNKIILYDNNDLDGECLADPIGDYIEAKQVDLIDARGKIGYQVEAYNDCYQNYSDKVDGILFADIDEFIVLTQAKSIQEYLQDQRFSNFNQIYLHGRCYTDNNLVTVENDNYSVLQRFTEPATVFLQNRPVKAILKTRIPGLLVNSVHGIKAKSSRGETTKEFENSEASLNVVCTCAANGQAGTPAESGSETDLAYLKHFRYKTIQEYLELKCKRGYPMPYKNYGQELSIDEFFIVNQATTEKISYVKSGLLNQDILKEIKIQIGEAATRAMARNVLEKTYQKLGALE